MAAPNYGQAANQTQLMLQKVNKKVELAQNLDSGLDKLFSSIGPGDEIGLQDYRLPIQTEVGGVAGYYNPDGGTYFQGSGPQYDQMKISPQAILLAFTTTELARRISKAGLDIVAKNFVGDMIGRAKDKASHIRNAYLQGYNNGIMATVDATFGGTGTSIPLAATPFGGRLLNRGDQLLYTDASLNVVGQVAVIDVTHGAIGSPDLLTVDNNPGIAVGGNFIPIGLASGNPIAINGIQYLISPAITGDLCGIARANSYVQAPSLNAGGAFLTNAGLEVFLARMVQQLGGQRFRSDRKRNKWYGHQAQWSSARIQGFAKMNFYNDGSKPMTTDIGPDAFGPQMLAGLEFIDDSMAAIDKLYFLDTSSLKRVRYPDSEKFLPGPLQEMFWPRTAGGLNSSQSDMYYQDSVNYACTNPWANGVLYNLAIQPAFAS